MVPPDGHDQWRTRYWVGDDLAVDAEDLSDMLTGYDLRGCAGCVDRSCMHRDQNIGVARGKPEVM